MLPWYFFLAISTLLVLQFIQGHHVTAKADHYESQHTNDTRSYLQENKCATWHYHDINGQCQCHPQKVNHMPDEWIKCSNSTVLLVYGNCMTYDEHERSTYVAECPYFQVDGHKVSHSDPGYIELPLDVSKLTEYMCGPVNRKGLLCTECIDGFGTSFTSLEHTCSNCTNSYGIPLYVLAEIVPLTLFYLLILVFQINLTNSPMTCYIYYCQTLISLVSKGGSSELNRDWFQERGPRLAVYALYGMWNLDIIRYVLPPFCISSKLTFTHISLLGYVSVIFPLCLIIITWISVELHDHNFKPLVWLWRPFHGCFVKLQRGWDTKSDIIDVFCSFLLLSYTKVVYQTAPFVVNLQKVVKANESRDISLVYAFHTDPHIVFGNTKYILFCTVTSVLILLSSIPPLLLMLYPLKCFRVGLSKCRLDFIVVEMFVKKFHHCYKDGLNEQRNMRSCSGLYFLLRLVSFVSIIHSSEWIVDALVYSAVAVAIAFFKPYKKNYMNVLDTLILLNSAAISHLITSSGYKIGTSTYIYILCLLPGSIFWICFVFKLMAKVWANLPMKRCFGYVYMILCAQGAHIHSGKQDSCHDSECNQPLLQQPSSTITATEINLPSP